MSLRTPRKNMKLVRLRLRVADARRKLEKAIGTPAYAHRDKVFTQRTRIYSRALRNSGHQAPIEYVQEVLRHTQEAHNASL